MGTRLTRRQLLRLAVIGSFGSTLAACTNSPLAEVPTTAPTQAAAAPTSAPTLAPTSVPTVANAATAAATSAAPAAPSATPAPNLATTMAQAAAQWLDTLNSDGRSQASYAFADPERTRWHWTTPQNFPRNGLPLSDMSQPQRDQALALLRSSLAPEGFAKAEAIMALQAILGNNPLQYYVTVFGDPGGTAPWSWRWEGHHYSRHFTVVGEQVTATPFFLGAWPTTTDAGSRAMPREEDAARELVTSLSGPLRDQAIFSTRTLTQHITQNEPVVSPLEGVGVAYSDLGTPQQALIMEIITTYLNNLPEPLAGPLMSRLQTAGVEQIRFGWAGPLEPQRPAYYRLQGPTFLLEFDNSRNGGTHIHSVWRDFAEDFGRHLVG